MKKHNLLSILLTSAATGAAAFATLAIGVTPAFAADADAAAEASAPAVNDEIVVTARRKQEGLQSVPVAITAFSQTTLERKSISDPFSLNKAVPGLQVNADSGNSSLPTFSIRGRGQFFGAASGSVETYFADVPLSAPFQVPTLPPQFFDLQSVQVLKGPQGTLFGRNTTGGAVLFVPAGASTDALEGYARLQTGNYGDIQVEGAVNVPIGEKVALRVAGFGWHRKGYSKSIPFRTDQPGVRLSDPSGQLLPLVQRYDNQDVKEARATLLLQPSDDLTNSTIFTYHTDKNRSTQRLIGVNFAHPSFYGTIAAASFSDFATLDRRTTRGNVLLTRKPSSTFGVINTTTGYLSEALTVKNIFGYINARGYGNNPGSADGFPAAAVDLPAPAHQLRNYQTTDELQFQGNLLDNSLTYIFGGLIDLTRQPGANDRINITTNSFPAGNGSQYDEQFRQSRFTSKSLFASATYKFTDQLSASAGIRHTWDNISERSCEYNPYPTSPDATVCATTRGFTTGSEKFKGFSYNASLEYRPDSGTMVYGGYRRGYKRGGFNAKGSGLVVFNPEKVDDFYVGLKKDLSPLGVRGHFNIEGFYDKYKNAQRSYLAFDLTQGALSTVVQNAPKQTYKGIDMDLVVDVSDWLELSGNYTFVDAKYGKYPDNTCQITVPGLTGLYCFSTGASGFSNTPGAIQIGGGAAFVPVANVQAGNPGDQGSNPVGLVSRNKFSATARFHHELTDGSEIAFAPTVSYQTRFYINDQSFRQPNSGAAIFGAVNSAANGGALAPGYALFDVRVEWNKVLGSQVDLAANVNNIANKTYIIGGSGIYQLGFNNVTFGAPRMITVEAKVHF